MPGTFLDIPDELGQALVNAPQVSGRSPAVDGARDEWMSETDVAVVARDHPGCFGGIERARVGRRDDGQHRLFGRAGECRGGDE